MSTFRDPVGPRSAKVYWRRRALVLVGLVVVILVIVLIVVRPGASSGEPSAAGGFADGGAAPDASTTDADAASEPAASEPTASTAKNASDATVDGDPCEPDQITVEALTDKSEYASGENPQLSMAVTNTGSNDCVLDVGTAAQVFSISSGDDTYWTSTDCQEGAEPAEALLEAGARVESAVPIEWDRTRSAPDTCDSDDREKVPSDGASYHLSVAVDDAKAVESPQFLLR